MPSSARLHSSATIPHGLSVGHDCTYLFVALLGLCAGLVGLGLKNLLYKSEDTPLTAIASVAEMTGNFTLLLPIMLAVGIATAVSRRFSYGSISTTKLSRRGIDIERPRLTNVLQSR